MAEEILDVLVAGGGPAGTAASFRCRELGLSVRVLDFDDILKRIRDYSKDKLILPGFGGGDRLCFPKGGAMISALRFEPIDKDDMCARWKALYREHGVEAAVGFELTGLERRADGLWQARVWDHGARCDGEITARAVVLALGRGVPRRFDIPGDTEGIAYRLSDPAHFVGDPACVIGGGTSAAEAVIAISNSKAAAGDPTAVYWSYRGVRMPRVSRGLAEVFFEAYVGNGNIRYYPSSEPAAVVVGEDRGEYLSVRVDRRGMEGRPRETLHLEFPKAACVACIGEDLPFPLLGDLGISPVAGGPSGKVRLVVDRFLQSPLENVFLAGDLLSQAYFETDDFDADPAGFREIRHRGNVKSALRDGVLVAEAIRQKLDGKATLDARVEDDEEPEAGAQRLAVTAAARTGPPAESLEEIRRPPRPRAVLVRLLPGGVEEEEHPLESHGVTTVGRSGCHLSFPHDTQLSASHASIAHREEGYELRDDGSDTGVFYRLPAARKMEVGAGDLVRVGRQFLLFDPGDDGEPAWVHFDAGGAEVGRRAVAPGTEVVGRAGGTPLDPGDRTLSRRHLAIGREGAKLWVKDLKSANGSYLKVRRPLRLEHGDRFRAGQQTFVFSLRDEPLDAGHHRAQAAPVAVPAAAPPPAATGAGAASVAFGSGGDALPAAPSVTVCDLAERHGVEITAECHAGICGSDPVRILSGAEHVTEPADDQERETLEELCRLEPGEHRLACQMRVTGPVVVEILEPRD